MRYQLDLTLRQAEGALARVLGTAERRGFRPLSVDGETQPDGDRWHLRMTVEGERSDESLQNQLAKLYDCLAVQVLPCP
jgi:acetolactate synthase II small subunit